ncbi:hypothetical protein GGTG_07031 [Gaeumannomyces tritici R3-111a-1]|uniref:GATA-type domain-containing protein n=1 Tax=Gaeumannomyces tritici (strain R3-111a-1) TaxID=644352 RepID=J3P0I6_GAET3|nr:hypothetical protein GGTG_07031 [Gaeumannomyces tritici R3-111a-1]EJT77119.1 hypothetical protein GGTG_07031 [Gaeumannomyces tritici R3-111a-1]
MEEDDSGSRHSGPNSATSTRGLPDYYDQRPRDSHDRPYRPASSAMATAALISPSTPYHPHHSPYPASAPSYPPHPSVPAMISPVESNRRPSDDSDANTHRTSLPSIRDIMNVKGQNGSGPQTLPSPFSSQPSGAPPPPPRSYAEPPPTRERPPSPPRPLHPSSAYPRSETLPAFSDASRPPLGPPHAGPPQLSIYPGAPPAPLGKPDSAHEIDRRSQHHPGGGPEGGPPPHVNGHYSHHGPPPPPPPHPSQGPPPPPPHPHAQQSHSPYSNGPPVPLPPGQLPLGPYPMSPRHHGGPPLHSPYASQRPPMGPEEAEYARRRGKYEQLPGHHYDVWNYSDALAKIGSSSRQILSFAETYGKIAQEEQGPPPPGRLPTEQEIADMVSNCETIHYMLDMVRGSVNHTIMNQRMREGSRARGFPEDEDGSMFHDGMKPGYGGGEVKKRRGRAAPPGRCHSCNRIDTPEWRRGPDGARTLCNACGLHYAKLERKRQMEQRGGNKSRDERN